MSKISTRMIGALAVILVFTGAVVSSAYFAVREKSDALEELYSQHIVPLRDLKVISDRYAVDIVDAAHKVRNGNQKPAEGLDTMRKALQEIDLLWSRYSAAKHHDAEIKLLNEAKQHVMRSRKATEIMISYLETDKISNFSNYVVEEMYGAIEPGTDKIGEIIDFLLTQARVDFEPDRIWSAFDGDIRVTRCICHADLRRGNRIHGDFCLAPVASRS